MVNSVALFSSLSSCVRKCPFLSIIINKPLRNVYALATKKTFEHCSYRTISCSCQANKMFVVNNNEEFMEKVMKSKVPVIVNFHAEWCEPCKILSPKLQALVEPLQDVDLAMVDVESNAELVHTFEVKAVPAVLALHNGLVVDKFIGLVDANMIENLVQKLMSKPAS